MSIARTLLLASISNSIYFLYAAPYYVLMLCQTWPSMVGLSGVPSACLSLLLLDHLVNINCGFYMSTFICTVDKAAPVAETPTEKRLKAVKARRIADREARRTRRRQARQSSRHSASQDVHYDGLSSDDEENKSDVIKYQSERGV